MIVIPLIIILLLATNAFYVASEFAAVGVRRTRIIHLAEGGDTLAQRLRPIIEDPDKLDEFVAACQLGITASSLVLGFYGQRALAEPLAATGLLGGVAATSTAVIVVLFFLTTLQVVLGEIVPKAIALRYPERIALLVTYPMVLSTAAFKPLIRVFNGSADVILRLVGREGTTGHSHLHSAREIEILVSESGQHGELDPIERQMLQNAFDLGELVARQVMIPRNRLDMADVTADLDELLRRLGDSPYDRLPIYEDTPDRVLGVVHLKDLMRLHINGAATVRDMIREVPFLPETVPISQLWQQLIVQGHPAVILIDEYGGCAGMATQEDLIEEVIGEVQHEFDVKPERIVYREGAPPLVRGDVLVEDVNEELGVELTRDRADTVGGLVVDLLGRMPKPRDSVETDGVTLRVHSVRGRAVFRVAVQNYGRDDQGDAQSPAGKAAPR